MAHLHCTSLHSSLLCPFCSHCTTMASLQPPNRPERKRDRAKRILKNIFNRLSSRSRASPHPAVVSQAASPADARTSSPQPASVPVETTPDTRPSSPHLPTSGRPSHAETRPSGASSAGVANKIKAIARVAGNGLETTIRLLEKSAAACPPLESAVGGLVACLDLAQVSSGR